MPKPPNLPQHNLPEPYARLLDLDLQEPDETFEKLAKTLKAQDTDAAVQKLIALVQDDTFYSYADKYPNFTEYMKREKRMLVPSHSVRLLTEIGESAQAAIVPLIPFLGSEDDFLREELPVFYGAMGLPAIEPLSGVLLDSEALPTIREGAGDSLVEIGEKYPELRERAIAIIEQALAHEKEDTELNAFFVGNLIDLGAKESVGIIEQAYAEERVDQFVVSLREVQEAFELPLTAQAPDWEDLEDDEEALEFPLPAEPAEPVSVPFVAGPKTGRNEPCPCGSGLKYKKCHGA